MLVPEKEGFSLVHWFYDGKLNLTGEKQLVIYQIPSYHFGMH